MISNFLQFLFFSSQVIFGYSIKYFLSISYGSGSPKKWEISFKSLFILSSKSVELSITLKWGCPVHASINLSSAKAASSTVSVLAVLFSVV